MVENQEEIKGITGYVQFGIRETLSEKKKAQNIEIFR